MPASAPQLPLLIDTQAALDDMCAIVEGSERIALDTEFVRTRTYAPHLGLVQIAAGGHAVCIDPLADLDYAALWPLLFDPQRRCIMHSATQDLEVLWYHCGDIVHGLIDTQICAAFLNYPPQIGYAGLVADLTGVELSKEQTRTDWTRRPLTEAQVDYAAKDVVYLDGMHDLLRERLEQRDRYQWALDDSAALCDTALYAPDPAQAWQKLKSIPLLPPAVQARAIALAAWREERAVTLDKPRRWVLDDKALLDIASADPADTRALAQLESVPGGIARRQGDALLQVLGDGNAGYAAHPERFTTRQTDRDAEKALSKKLGGIVRRRASELDIAPEVLGSKREITALMRNDPACRLLRGWRLDVVGRELQAEL